MVALNSKKNSVSFYFEIIIKIVRLLYWTKKLFLQHCYDIIF